MINQVILAGKIRKLKKNKGQLILNIAITRSEKNSNGSYDKDFINCNVSEVIEPNSIEFCQKNNIVGIRGKLQSKNNKIEIKADRITFLKTINN